MSYAVVSGVKITGLCGAVPTFCVDNLEQGSALYGKDIASLIKTTGVRFRRVSPENKTTAFDLSVYAAQKLRELGYFAFETFGGVVFVTQTPDNLMPNNASLAQDVLGFSTHSFAMDVNQACSGYPYGLLTTALLVRATNKPFLLLDGETNSHYVSPQDKSTALLFGDAGTATIIEPVPEGEEETTWHFEFDTDGSFREALVIPEGGYRNRVNPESSTYRSFPDGGVRRGIDMKMDGMTVFNYVVRNVPKNISRLLANTEDTPGSVDYLVLHQANEFMVRQVAKKVGFVGEKVPMTVGKFGNSSSPTIPITIASELASVVSGSAPQRLLLSGFGAGLSIASALISVSDCFCPGVVEYDCE